MRSSASQARPRTATSRYGRAMESGGCLFVPTHTSAQWCPGVEACSTHPTPAPAPSGLPALGRPNGARRTEDGARRGVEVGSSNPGPSVVGSPEADASGLDVLVVAEQVVGIEPALHGHELVEVGAVVLPYPVLVVGGREVDVAALL